MSRTKTFNYTHPVDIMKSHFRHSQMCWAVGAALAASVLAVPLHPPCPLETSHPWCDTSQPTDVRVKTLIANLTDSEKAGLFLSGAAGVARISWPK